MYKRQIYESVGFTREGLTPEDVLANLDAIMDLTNAQLIAVPNPP